MINQVKVCDKEKLIKTIDKLINVSLNYFEEKNYTPDMADNLKGRLFKLARERGYLQALRDIKRYIEVE